MEILGYLAALLIGISLGLTGSGGSILAVPILVYLFRLDAVTATGYSLFIVGITSLVGAYAYLKNGIFDLRAAVSFGIPSILTVMLTRLFIIPAIPDVVMQWNNATLTKNLLLLMLFAILMIMAATKMIRNAPPKLSHPQPSGASVLHLVLQGAVVGVVTGLVGAGGGFLIIPALVLISNLEMKKAVGTSLAIIAANTLLGFAGSINHLEINWMFLLSFTALAIIGIFPGMAISKRINGQKLKPAFGYFILGMGIFILLKETVFS